MNMIHKKMAICLVECFVYMLSVSLNTAIAISFDDDIDGIDVVLLVVAAIACSLTMIL